MEIGLNENGDSQAVKYGIQVRRFSFNWTGNALKQPSLLGFDTWYDYRASAPRPELESESPEGGTEADYVQIVGGQVGSASGSNTVGIQVVTDGDGE